MEKLSQIFAYGDQLIRVVESASGPQFIVQDVCRVLGIENYRHAVALFPDDERGVVLTDTPSNAQQMLYVTEPGLYRLIFRSDKPKAEEFRRWVFHEVLPRIRKTGGYALESRLWEAYDRAKTGKVQLAILAALGLPAPSGSAQRKFEPSVPPGQFWKDVLPFADQLLQRFAVRRLTSVELALDPAAVLEQLRSLPAYQDMTRAHLLGALVDSPEWAGVRKARFGPGKRKAVISCWAFRVEQSASPELQALLALLKDAGQ